MISRVTRGTQTGVITMAAAVTWLATLVMPAAAASMPDPLRCEALGLFCASRHSDCLARCDRVADRRVARDPEKAEEYRTTCAGTCEDRYTAGMARLKQRPVCRGIAPADPNPWECQADQQRADANYMLCQARCNSRKRHNESFDAEACLGNCKTVYLDARDAVLRDPVCASGPVMAPIESDGSH
jgi:hypothetical protein